MCTRINSLRLLIYLYPSHNNSHALVLCIRWLVDLPDDSLDGTRSATLAMLRTLLFTGQTMRPLDSAVTAGGEHLCCYLVMSISHTEPEDGPDLVLNNFTRMDTDKSPFEGETVKVQAMLISHLYVRFVVI